MPRDYNGDKPKRSWREIDNKKDSSRHRDADRSAMSGNRQVRADAASAVYKSKLDSFFDGEAKAPAHVAQKMSAIKDESPEGKERAKALLAIKDAGTSSAADKAVAAYLAKWELPPDFDILSQVLTCADEEYVEQGIEAIDSLLENKRVPKRVDLLEQRLRRVKTLADDPELQDRADQMIRKLRLFK